MYKPKITIRGSRAIASSKPLWVLGLDGYWVEAFPNTRDRARKMPEHALWIYGIE